VRTNNPANPGQSQPLKLRRLTDKTQRITRTPDAL